MGSAERQRSTRSRMRLAAAALGALAILLAGCGPKVPPHLRQPPSFAFNPDVTVRCSDPAAPGCAAPSAFDGLVEAAAAGPDGQGVHYVKLLDIGDEALLLRIHLIRAARKSIYVQQFIWSSDDSGLLIFAELVKAARRGVEVKIVSDQLFTVGDARAMAAGVVAHRNLQIELYNPTFDKAQVSKGEMAAAGLRLSGINQRMHAKLLVVDEEVAILGGRNHEDKYFDRDPDFNFKDRDILVIGPKVADMVLSFREYLDYDFSVPAQDLTDVRALLESRDYQPFEMPEPGPRVLDIDSRASDTELIRELFVARALRVEGRVEVYADAPGKPYEGLKRKQTRHVKSTGLGILEVVEEATSELLIQTPYLILKESTIEWLKARRREHRGLKIIASTNSLASIDHFLAYSIMVKQHRRLLLTLGMRIFEFKPVPGDVNDMVPRYAELILEAGGKHGEDPNRMQVTTEGPVIGLHAKSLVVDDRIALVGSHNFDPRSTNFDTQSVIAIWDRQVAQALKANILRDMAAQNSWVRARQQQVPVISFFTGIIETISRALPVGDVWPFHYSGNFELRDGEAPVPPGHPEFYRRYKNVGQFPGVDNPARVVYTRLFSTVGGWTTPMM